MSRTASIRRKVTLTLFAGFGLALAVAAGALLSFEYRAAGLRARATAESLADALAFSLVAALDFDSPETAAQTLRRLDSSNAVVAARVWRRRPDGGATPFASFGPAGAPPPDPAATAAGFVREGARARLLQPLRSDGRIAGWIALEVDVREFRRGFGDLLGVLGFISIVLAVAGLGLSRLLQRALTRPLLQLAETAGRVHATGDLAIRAPVESHDEIGRLAATFNEMVAGLDQRDRQLAENYAFQRAILEGAGAAVITTGLDLVVRTFNRAAEQLLGYRSEEVVGRLSVAAFHDPDELGRRARDEAARHGLRIDPPVTVFIAVPSLLGSYAAEWNLHRQDGSVVPAHLVVSPLRSGRGEMIGLCGVVTDLRERRAAEEALRASELRFRLLSETSLVGLLVVQDGLIRYANPQMAVLLGYARTDDLLGRRAAELIAPEFRSEVSGRIASVLAGATVPPHPGFQAIRRDGSHIWVQTGPVRTSWDGRPAVQTFVLDITERKNAEDARRTADEGFRLLVEHSPEAIVVVDLQAGRFVIANPAAAQLLGYSREELLRLDPVAVSPPRQPDGRSSTEAAAAYLEAAVRGERPVFAWTHRHANGRAIDCEVRLLRLPATDPHHALIRGTIVDVGERRQTAEALRVLTQQTAALTGEDFFAATTAHLARQLGVKFALIGQLGSTPDGAIEVQTLAVWADGPAPGFSYKLAGTPCEQATRSELCHFGDHVAESFPDDPLLRQMGAVSYIGAPVRTPKGEVLGIIAVLDTKPMPDSAAARFLLAIAALRSAAEISRLNRETAIQALNAQLEQRVRERTAELDQRIAEVERLNADLQASQRSTDRAAARLQEANSSLLAANQELEAFSYSVSHDLRAPLRNITGFIELLRKRLAGKLEPEPERFLSIIVAEAVRMGGLIDDLLTFSRVGRTEIRWEPVRLEDLVAEVRQELHHDLQDRRINWRVETLPTVYGDRLLLRQVVANLVSNAVKFTRHRDRAEITIGVRPRHPNEPVATFFVRDNGAGFNPRYLDKLFRVFQRLHNARDFEGTGIGLANVKRIVTRHGGRVWAEGEVDRGATFYFTLRHTPPRPS